MCSSDLWELDLDELALETVQGLADNLAPYDLSEVLPGILDGLYRQTAPATPRWLAEYILEDELGLAKDPDLSLVDPACGTGVFLTAAIEAMSRNVADPLDVLFEAPEKIRGMDREPLAVALARLNYLLALGDLVQEEHPPFLLPVYLADAHRVPVVGRSDPRPDARPLSAACRATCGVSAAVVSFVSAKASCVAASSCSSRRVCSAWAARASTSAAIPALTSCSSSASARASPSRTRSLSSNLALAPRCSSTSPTAP